MEFKSSVSRPLRNVYNSSVLNYFYRTFAAIKSFQKLFSILDLNPGPDIAG